MDKSAAQPLISGNAYKIFRSEIAQHVQNAKQVLARDQAAVTESELRAMGINCHTIKGGAGFLGFPEVALCAGKIEHLLLKSEVGFAEKLSQANELMQQLDELAQRLPEPKQPV